MLFPSHHSILLVKQFPDLVIIITDGSFQAYSASLVLKRRDDNKVCNKVSGYLIILHG